MSTYDLILVSTLVPFHSVYFGQQIPMTAKLKIISLLHIYSQKCLYVVLKSYLTQIQVPLAHRIPRTENTSQGHLQSHPESVKNP